MKKCFVLITALFFVSVATVVFAQGPSAAAGGPPAKGGAESFRGPGPYGGPAGPEGSHPGWGHWSHGRFGHGEWLGLSKEQIEKMKALRDRFFSETRDLRYETAQKRLEMRKLFMDPKTDDATLLAKQKEMSALRQKLADKMAQMMIEGRKILTPEQLQKLDRMGMGAMGGMGFGMMDGAMGHDTMDGPMGRGMMGHGMMEHGMGGCSMMGCE
jgi:Spy/CpxP family protein refolding chaperone